MKLDLVKNAMTSRVARQILIGKKNSPAVMFGVGIVAGVGCVITACNATLKLDSVVEDAEKKRFQIRELQHNDYSEIDRKKDHLYLNIQTAVKIGKLYAPAIGLGAVSVGLLTGSHVTLNRRNAGLTAAYAALDRGFKEYRDRIEKEVGPERELELRRNIQVTEKHDAKAGTVTVKRTIGPEGVSPYAVLFDETTSNSWQKQPEYNLVFLKANQNYANDRLRAKGHLLLNDVYDMLGLERTKAGCVVGWVRNGDGDGYVDFGIFRNDNMLEMANFMMGHEGAIWLDFNVDGVVYDLI